MDQSLWASGANLGFFAEQIWKLESNWYEIFMADANADIRQQENSDIWCISQYVISIHCHPHLLDSVHSYTISNHLSKIFFCI